MFRCANDIWGYCAGEPQSIERPQEFYYTEVTGKKVGYTGTARACLKDKNTCGQFQTLHDLYGDGSPKKKVKA